jgi:geranylgeranyl diphosphate synthase type II
LKERLSDFIHQHQKDFEEALRVSLPVSDLRGTHSLNEALEYALFPGGKRLRPVITLLCSMLVGTSAKEAMPIACAIELLHTSSIIFDDLPAMDDADIRRGRATLHAAFGEGVAILTALALLNQSYSLLAQTAAKKSSDALRIEKLVSEAANCIGARGMIGGQVVDIEIQRGEINSEILASRNLKTTALMKFTATAGAITFGADEKDVCALARFGECLGAAYQITDDVLDELGECDVIGKTVKQDARHLRLTFAGVDIEKAHRLAINSIEESKSVIVERFGNRYETNLLKDIADLVIGRVERLMETV